MIVSTSKFFSGISGGLGRFLKWALLFPLTAFGSVSTTVTWNPSPDASVTGYNLYYGSASRDYTNVISVGNVTNAVIDELSENTTYFFAAKAHDDAGDESEFSNEATFGDYQVDPNHSLNLNTMPSALAGDQVVFTLASGAPAAASIDPATGVLSWKPGPDDAGTTSSITVIVTDLTNPDASTQINLVVTVSDYLDVGLGSTPVQTGQFGSLMVMLTANQGVTNLAFNVNWPGERLLNPTLIFNPPVAGGTLLNQGTNLVIQLWTANASVLAGTSPVAVLNFQAADSQSSAFVALPVSGVSANKPDGSIFSNTTAEPGEVIIVGLNPLLQANADVGQGRSLTLYANPGNDYQLQYATSLSPPIQWQPLQDYSPVNVEQTINLDSDNPVIYYRLMQQCDAAMILPPASGLLLETLR